MSLFWHQKVAKSCPEQYATILNSRRVIVNGQRCLRPVKSKAISILTTEAKNSELKNMCHIHIERNLLKLFNLK